MAPAGREPQRSRGFQYSPRRNVPIQPKEGAPGSRPFTSAAAFQQAHLGGIPTQGKALNFKELSLERQQRVNDLSRRLSSWEQLAINAVARGESLPQTRQRALMSLMRAANPNLPLEASPAPNLPTYNKRIHNPEPRLSSGGISAPRSGQGSRSSSHTDKQGPRKRDNGKGVAFNLDQNKEHDSEPKWFDVYGIDWKDRHKYRFELPRRSGGNKQSGGSRPLRNSRKKRKDAATWDEE